MSCFALATSAQADVRLPAIFANDMVIQRETQAPVWGWADPGEPVVVRASWPNAKIVETKAGADGRWSIKLPTPAAGGPYTIAVAGKNSITLGNVMVGEVWICSGQSNMEWPVSASMDAEKEIAAADFPNIRQFDVPNVIAYAPQSDCKGTWQTCSPKTAANFTAVGYYFGRELHRKLNVPIGLINSTWGGTVAEAWASEQTIAAMPDFAKDMEWVRGQRRDAADLGSEAKKARDAWWGAVNQDRTKHGDLAASSFDDSGWAKTTLPGAWAGDLAGFDGVIWYRRSIELPKEFVGKDLHLALGPIDDMDAVWFDGQQVGGYQTMGYHGQARHYRIPASLTTAGRHTICIAAADLLATGGLTGKPEDLYLSVLPPGSAVEDEKSRTGERLPLAGEWKWQRGPALKDLPSWPTEGENNPNKCTVLYNGMIAPVQTYAIRGAVWYQGESNRGRAAQYRTLFPAMIADWRRVWNQGDFPFYFVQIAPYRYGGDTGQTAELREAQMMTMATPNTGMAVTMDIGNPADIHPTNKQEVGRRLSLWALAKTYGQASGEYCGPIYKSMKVEGSSIRVEFDHADGLALKDADLSFFDIAGADGKFVPATAVIDGQSVVVSSSSISSPTAVRYGWDDDGEPNLFNGSGLPASPFRTNAPTK